MEERVKIANKILYTEDNIKADLKQKRRMQIAFTWLRIYIDQWRAFVNTGMNLWDP